MKRLLALCFIFLLLCGCTKTSTEYSGSLHNSSEIVTDIVDSSDVSNVEIVTSSETSQSTSTTTENASSNIVNSSDVSSINNENSTGASTSNVSSTTSDSHQNQVVSFPMGQGNTYSNIVNSEGLMANNGEWIFYSNNWDEGALYKIKTDGTGNQRIGTDKMCSYINVVDEWIIYLCYEELKGLDIYSAKIIKSKIDGTEREVLVSNWSVGYVHVKDKKLYFSSGSSRASADVYVMDLETKKTTNYGNEILPNTSHYTIPPYFEGEWIYFLDSFNSDYKQGILCRIKKDGTEKTQLTENVARKFDIHNGWVYYLDFNFKIRRVRVDGTEDSSVFSNDFFTAISVSDDGIFASSGELYKISHDGLNHQKFSTKIALDDFFFTVTNNHVYYIHNKEDGKYNELYRINKDGNDMQLLPFMIDW